MKIELYTVLAQCQLCLFAGITGEEYEEKLKLEEEKRAADEKYRYKRRQIKELQENLQVKYKQKSQLDKAEGCCHTNRHIESIEHSGTIFSAFSFTSYSLYQWIHFFF